MWYNAFGDNMTRIYFLRHCEAEGNVQKIFQGTTDTDISARGKEQLKYLTNRFRDIKIDKAYSSPLIRAKKTAFAAIEGKNMGVVERPRLCELHGGIVEGKPFRETFDANPKLKEVWDNHPQDFAPEGGEAMRDAYERIWNETIALARENEGKTIIASTHGGLMRLLHCRLFYHTIDRLVEVPWSENTAVTLVEFDNALTPTVVFFNDVSHLDDSLRTSFKTQEASK